MLHTFHLIFSLVQSEPWQPMTNAVHLHLPSFTRPRGQNKICLFVSLPSTLLHPPPPHPPPPPGLLPPLSRCTVTPLREHRSRLRAAPCSKCWTDGRWAAAKFGNQRGVAPSLTGIASGIGRAAAVARGASGATLTGKQRAQRATRSRWNGECRIQTLQVLFRH